MKKIFKNINWKVFVVNTLILAILFWGVLFYMLVVIKDENEKVSPTVPTLIQIIVFPFGYLIDSLFPHTSDALFITALFLDILFFAFLFERVYTFFKRRKKIEE